MPIMEGFARRFIGLRSGKSPLEVRFTHQESLAVGMVESPGAEMARAGRRFMLAYNGTAPTGVAPVQAFPTTAAQWAIWNADPIKTYFFETLGILVFSGTNAIGGSLLAAFFTAPVQLGANATGLTVINSSGSTKGSAAIIKSGVTITGPAAPNWGVVADTQLSGVATVPSSVAVNRLLGGRVALQPGQGLGLAAFAPAGTSQAFLPIAEWYEQETDME